MWFYVQHVVIGRQLAEAALRGVPRGNLCDLYPRWLGARELLLHRRNPYSPEITREIQIGYYGRPLDPNRPNDPQDQMAFAYPLYVVFLLAPMITLPFFSVRLVAHWLFVLLTAASVPLWLRAMRWRAPLALTAILVMLTLGNLPIVLGIKLEQLTLLVGGMVAGCVLLSISESLVLAGILLAIATIKPQLVFLFAAWLLLWALGNYNERRRLLWSFVLSMFILCAAAEFVMPGWIGQFANAITAYRQYTGRQVSILSILTTPALGPFLSVLVLVALAIYCWRARHVPADDPLFILICSLALAVTLIVIPMTSLYNQILLLPAVLLIVRHAGLLWRKDPVTRLLCIVAGLAVSWPWLAALVLDLASVLTRTAFVERYWAAPLWSSMTIPLAVLLLLARLTALKLASPDPSASTIQGSIVGRPAPELAFPRRPG
jgi:Glycosyltransferase family 87